MNELKKLAAWATCLLMIMAGVTACGDDDTDDVTDTVALTVTTPVVSDITTTTAQVSATATGTGVTSRGVCYAEAANPTVNDQKAVSTSADISLTLTGLTASTTYHVRAFVQAGTEVKYSADVTFTTDAEAEEPGNDDQPTTDIGDDLENGASRLKTVSVHDPSVVYDHTTGYYYIFGSHRAWARSSDLMTWVTTNVSWATPTIANTSAYASAFTTPAVKKVTKGGQEVDFPAFSALAWSKRGSTSYSLDGNMWAPDVIYNTAMNKWCMYMSINGDSWYSSIVLLTADKITGPYLYQGPVVISGFQSGTSYKDTDLELVLGTQTSLPSRYNVGTKWGQRYPNAIDPCVFYDETGKLWMSYGSWSGGIYMLELDESTGLRDYDVTYTLKGSGDGITVDPYFGKKIAGGYYSSGEASYIEHIDGYYYLFVSYGGLAAGGAASDYNNGGYQMRVFRSQNPDGPYVDSKNAAALYSSYLLNFGPKESDGNRGVNIFGAYGEWGNKAVGNNAERSQGHNSAIAAPDGRSYLVYHTRFQNKGEGHEVRVHQLFQNEDGWLVAAPFEYTGEAIKSEHIATKQQIAKADIPGKYKLLMHNYKLDHTNKELSTPKEVTLAADGTIAGDYTGTWAITEGTCYITINIGTAYKGVMIRQTLEPKNEKAPAFTALRSATGVTVWGYRYADL